MWQGWPSGLGNGWVGMEEWTMHGVSTRIHELPPNANGAQLTFLNIAAHVSRNSSFYFWCGTLYCHAPPRVPVSPEAMNDAPIKPTGVPNAVRP